MDKDSLLEGKRILIVDDEPDILETLEDLLPMCEIVTASSFEQGKELLDSGNFDLAVLDIMGVGGYELLDIAQEKNIPTAMLTAYALSPENVVKSFKKGAAFYIPKEKMVNIATYLTDILEVKRKGKNPWGRWYKRFADYCERKFGAEWKKTDEAFWEKFPFH